MRLLLGSTNPSKKRALEKALEVLNVKDYELFCFEVNSGVSSKPIGNEIIKGADNRNQELKKCAFRENIQYDYLCSVEGGFSEDETGLPFVVTYCVIESVYGHKSTGKSSGVRLSKTMFDYVKNGGSLNKVIEEITSECSNNQKRGITGYLTDGLLIREEVDKDAIISSFCSFLFEEKRRVLDLQIQKINYSED